MKGLEPPRLAAPDPKSGASTPIPPHPLKKIFAKLKYFFDIIKLVNEFY